MELHAYHNMGAYKWKELGYEYQLENVRNATEEDITIAKKILGI